jgi:hypothetical protein
MEEKIVNPITKRYIKVNGPTYMKLVEEGYKPSYLNSLKDIKTLELNSITDEQIQFNDDVMHIIINKLNLQELYALYHTNKYFKNLLDSEPILNELCKKYFTCWENINTFDDFVYVFNYKYNEYTLKSLNLIKSTYINENKKITECKSRRLDKTPLCNAKYNLSYGYKKEIDLLSSSKNDKEYKKNLAYLEYVINHRLLTLL